ncbi:MAG: hypothetical protein IH958_06570, partial [Chloroflexi bacterium]|nr:hypothetical protein [Chloroflexota bacterium]
MERLKKFLWRGKLRKAATIVISGFVVLVVIGAIASAFEEEKEDDKSAPPAVSRSETSTPEPTETPEPTTPEVQEQDEITQQIAALYPEAHPIWVDCVVITHDEGDELIPQELIESCGQPEAWKWFVPLAAEQFPQESSTWID